MFNRLSKTFLITASILFAAFLIFQPIFSADAALVPCGREGQPACTTCDIFILASNVINFVLFSVSPAIAVLLFLIAGFMILLGGANPGLISTGKNIFKTTVYGLLLVFGAWMITNTILKSLAGNYFDEQKDPWYRVVCVEPGVVAPPPLPPLPPPLPLPDLALGQPIASDLISMGINFSTSADCGNDFHASQNIQDIANAQYPAVCSSTCNCQPGGPNENISVNWLILQGLKELYNKMTSAFGVGFTVTSLTTGRHSTNSSHYTGEAVDIILNSSNSSDWQAASAFLDSLGGNAICERTSDSSDDPSCNLANINHIHWTLRR